ncbi:hypothetical protein ACHAWF_015522 [Thalassiosira exigua]
MSYQCAACGKRGDGLKMKRFPACKAETYCNKRCQRAHYREHKKECGKRAAAAKSPEPEQFSLMTDEEVFRQPSPNEDCPICFLPLPLIGSMTNYRACCGQKLCHGCWYADNEQRDCCPFCRTPKESTIDEYVEWLEERMKAKDAYAYYLKGCQYNFESEGKGHALEQAFANWLKAGELGAPAAHYWVAKAYHNGWAVKKDTKKATYYFQLGAVKGDLMSRHMLARNEYDNGNVDRSMKHWMIAASAGDEKAAMELQKAYRVGHLTKDDFVRTLRAHKQSYDQMKSDQRDTAFLETKKHCVNLYGETVEH